MTRRAASARSSTGITFLPLGLLALGALACGSGNTPPPSAPSECASGTFGPDCAGVCACATGGVCDEGRDGSGICANLYALDVTVGRDITSEPSPIVVQARLTNNGVAVPGAALTIQAGRGTVSAVVDVGNGDYAARVTPEGAGEHAITVAYADVTVRRVALVLPHVGDTWGQPMAVEGLVNTAGYEDGANVTPDGAYLFVQTGPIYFSGLLLASLPRASGGCGVLRLVPDRCTHPWIDATIGPFAAPERPGFFTGRIDTATGKLRHNSALYGLADEEAPIVAPITMFYGFHRQPDGSYAEPFYVAFDDASDAIVNPFGLNLAPSGTAVFALQDGQSPMIDADDDGTPESPSGQDVYTLPMTPGTNTVLGAYLPGSPPTRGTPFPSTRLAFGDTGTQGNLGTQGNPMLATDAGGAVWAVFTDDEFDSTNEDPADDDDADDISAYVRTGAPFPGGTWTKVILPTIVNSPTHAETQPFLDADGSFYFRRDSDLMRTRFTGASSAAALANPASWQTPTVELEHAATSGVDDVVAVGEPSVALVDGKRVLFFVYGRVRAVGDASGLPDIDMQVGMVTQR